MARVAVLLPKRLRVPHLRAIQPTPPALRMLARYRLQPRSPQTPLRTLRPRPPACGSILRPLQCPAWRPTPEAPRASPFTTPVRTPQGTSSSPAPDARTDRSASHTTAPAACVSGRGLQARPTLPLYAESAEASVRPQRSACTTTASMGCADARRASWGRPPARSITIVARCGVGQGCARTRSRCAETRASEGQSVGLSEPDKRCNPERGLVDRSASLANNSRMSRDRRQPRRPTGR
jgi:hypothetical protein